jgi:type IV pilus assembly protein PilB
MSLSAKTKIEHELSQKDNFSIVNIVDTVIEHAHDLRASDIHLDANEGDTQVRFRIDGMLQDMHVFPRNIYPEVVSRIKVLAALRTDEHQAPQDGRFRSTVAGAPVDVRVSVVPAYHGENVVLRLLADRLEEFTLSSLGLSKENQKNILRAIRNPHGMVLVTGPTGSGKTTTLYTMLKLLNRKDVSIVTIEDPIEYAISDVKQIQVNARAGLTFANGLRSILRQDPNIIMVGEIRDTETATIAVNTALTGHLLLSTLHTNDAATTLPRLLDMKIESYLVASTVNVTIGQRLVRKICKACAEPHELSKGEQESLTGSLSGHLLARLTKLSRGKGCSECNDTGYAGRIGIHEVLVVTPDIREAILRKASATELRSIAVRQGMKTILEDGIEKADAGITTIEEVLRVVHE